MVFEFARRMAPCMLVLEDIETMVNSGTRSYFFNEVDGLENNDGILMVASTNYLERLDPGLTKRPSRFDRKYLFPLPNKHERILYAEFWHNKIKDKSNVEYPKRLCEPIAAITADFSFAYMQEAFIATLLELARRRTDKLAAVVAELRMTDNEDPDQYVFWRVIKNQVKILREDMDSQDSASMQVSRGEPMPTSISVLPGTYHDDAPMSLSTSKMAFANMGRNTENDTDAGMFLSRFDKRQFVSSAALEFRPWATGLSWAKRS